MRKWPLILIVTAGLAFAASEVWLPAGIEGIVKGAIMDGVESVESLEVEVRSLPAASVFLGKLDSLKVDASRLKVSGLTVSRLLLEARGIRFDPMEVLWSRRFNLGGLGRSEITLVLNEEDINAYFRSRDGIMKNLSMELDRGKARLQGVFPFLGGKLSLSLDGEFVVEGGRVVRYVVKDFLVQDFKLPDFMRDQVFKGIDLSFDLGELPFQFELQEVRVEDEKIYVFGGSP